MRERTFSRADQDNSGGLSLDEFRSMAPGKNGRVPAEPAGQATGTDRAAAIFAKLDANGDGSVTPAELEAGRPRGHRHGGAPGGAFASGAMSALLSGQEASGTPGAGPSPGDLFARLDTNGDGSLTATEFQAGRPPPGGPRGGTDRLGLPSSRSDGTDGSASAGSTRKAEALAALVRKALENYLSAGRAPSAPDTLARA
ncbi:EF-hand domain-containing protein [Muricoccus nepalensis]|nr:EF-hand domain-containing protein [Roseomonas nepalensis]